MCKFIQISSDTFAKTNSFLLRYVPEVEKLFIKYYKYIQDDFSDISNLKSYILSLMPYFWIILDYDENFMGFAYLDNFIGNRRKLYSAELTTCFHPKAWGCFTRYSAKIFLKKCFDELGLQKVTACIYPDNFRVKNLLKSSGFIYESTLKNATLRFGKMQDIDVYGLYRSYYYE